MERATAASAPLEDWRDIILIWRDGGPFGVSTRIGARKVVIPGINIPFTRRFLATLLRLLGTGGRVFSVIVCRSTLISTSGEIDRESQSSECGGVSGYSSSDSLESISGCRWDKWSRTSAEPLLSTSTSS